MGVHVNHLFGDCTIYSETTVNVVGAFAWPCLYIVLFSHTRTNTRHEFAIAGRLSKMT